MIDKDTKIYGSFSTSPGNNGCLFFNNAFQKYQINAIYKSFYSDNIENSINSAKHLGFGGFAVSSPFKIKIIDFLDEYQKRLIIDSLPAKVYSTVLNNIIKNKEKILIFNNPILDKFRFNFLTNEPYLFLKGLFGNFDELYFRDVIFHLSKRIDGNILMNSTPIEIEYYIEKYADEMKSQNEGLTMK
jgi:hypothetical protein